MKEIIKFVADDGSIHPSKEACVRYESLLSNVNNLMNSLNKIPNTTAFRNGEGFVRQSMSVVKELKTKIVKVGREYLNIKDNIGFSIAGRYFDDCGVKCLYSAWGRLAHIDETGREWGQGYYAVNPEKGKQIDLTTN